MKQYDSAIGKTITTKPTRFRALSSRCGVFPYLINGKLMWQLRDEEEVFNNDSVDSFLDAVITIGHPDDDNDISEVHGTVYDVDVIKCVNDKDTTDNEVGIYTNFTLFTDESKELASSGVPTSPMYDVVLVEKQGDWNGHHYDFIQTNIRYTSLGLVSSARQKKTKVYYQLSKDSYTSSDPVNLIEIPQFFNMGINMKHPEPIVPVTITDQVESTNEIINDTVKSIKVSGIDAETNSEKTESEKTESEDELDIPVNFVINSEGGVNVNKDYLEDTIDVAMRAESMGLLSFVEAMQFSLSSISTVMRMILLKEGIEIAEWESPQSAYKVYMKLRPLPGSSLPTTNSDSNSGTSQIPPIAPQTNRSPICSVPSINLPVINHPTHKKSSVSYRNDANILTFDDLE